MISPAQMTYWPDLVDAVVSVHRLDAAVILWVEGLAQLVHAVQRGEHVQAGNAGLVGWREIALVSVAEGGLGLGSGEGEVTA